MKICEYLRGKVQKCFCFQCQPVSSLANLGTCRLYRGSLALAEAESSSGRRPVALLEHLDRTDLKAGGFQASNVVRIPSRNADSLIVGWLCVRFRNYTITILPPSVWFTWIGADFIRSAGHGWQWKVVRERALYSRPCGDGGSQGIYIPLESLMMLVVSRTHHNKRYCNIIFEGIRGRIRYTNKCHWPGKIMQPFLDSNAYVYGYVSSYHWADRWTHRKRGTETSAYLGPGRLTLGWEKWSDVNHDLISRFWRIPMASSHRVSCRELCNSPGDTVKWSNRYTTSWVKVACELFAMCMRPFGIWGKQWTLP